MERSKRHRIVTTFPKVFEYKRKLENLDCLYLMLAGGTSEDVSACIEYIKEPLFGHDFKGTVNVSCLDKGDDALKEEIYDKLSTFKFPTEEQVQDLIARNHEILDIVNMCKEREGEEKEIKTSTGTILQRIRDARLVESDGSVKNIKVRKKKAMTRNHNLYILNNISANNGVWGELTVEFENPIKKPPFLIATVKSKEEADRLPEPFQDLFEIVSLDGEGAGVEENASSNLTDNIFRYKGGRWEIIFDGVAIYPKDKEGFQYISCVLSNPKKELHNFRIYQLANSPVTGSVTKDQSLDAKLPLERSTKIKTTKEDKTDDYKKMKEILDDLEKEDNNLRRDKSKLEREGSVDASGIAEIDEQLNQNIEIRKSIAQGFNSSGGNKSNKEKIINNVRMNIYRSLVTIKKEHPTLHIHLKAFFTNGKEYTSYNPDRDIRWQTNRS